MILTHKKLATFGKKSEGFSMEWDTATVGKGSPGIRCVGIDATHSRYADYAS